MTHSYQTGVLLLLAVLLMCVGCEEGGRPESEGIPGWLASDGEAIRAALRNFIMSPSGGHARRTMQLSEADCDGEIHADEYGAWLLGRWSVSREGKLVVAEIAIASRAHAQTCTVMLRKTPGGYIVDNSSVEYAEFEVK
jgi:hypothetical protein